MKSLIGNKTIKSCFVLLLSALSAIAVLYYVENPTIKETSFSAILFIIWAAFYKAWKFFPRFESKAFYIYNGIFCFLFSLCTTTGRQLDNNLPIRKVELVLLTLGLFFAFFPVVSIITKRLEEFKAVGSNNYSLRKTCFLLIACSWFLGYLAVFPGVYATDAFTWYREFHDPSVPVSSQWSPVYAGIFYLFVHTGKVLFNNYEYGFALFIAIQSLIVLFFGVKEILLFVQARAGDVACILTTIFLILVPTHMIMTMHAAQGTPFMVCFTMVLIHLHRMKTEGDDYWQYYVNYGAFLAWGVACCVLRNNAYYVFLAFLVCLYFVQSRNKKRIFLGVITILVFATIYKGPLLDFFGVTKGTALKEALNMPLQQMACAYLQKPPKISDNHKKLLEKFIPVKALKEYSRYTGISDYRKSNLNIKLVRNNLGEFFKLYVKIGLEAPDAYLKAAYLQNLGMLYIDKKYQDTRIWHSYLDYVNYDARKKTAYYIIIERHSLFPAYEKLLSYLYGRLNNKKINYWGFAGQAPAFFTSVPILNVFCRASTYFWCLIYFLFFAAYKKYKEDFLYLALVVCFTLSVMFGPVILYRYYAPVMFAFPVIIAALFGDRKTDLNSN